MENLYHDFFMAIQPLESPLQVFEVLQRWYSTLSKIKNTERTLDSDVDDETFARLKTCVQAEQQCWDLLNNLYRVRVDQSNDGHERIDEFFQRDMYHINEHEVISHLTNTNHTLKELGVIVQWLEANYREKLPPDQVGKLISWEQTLQTLKNDRLIGKTSKPSMVTSLDPDVLTRNGKKLHELDEVDNAKAHQGAYYHLRTGDHTQAVEHLVNSGHIAYAASFYGPAYTQKYAKRGDYREGVPAQVVPAINRRICHSRPDYDVSGNVRRDLWKRSAFMICETNKQTKFERAALSALCGHRDGLLKASVSWEDQVWCYLKVAVDVILESGLRKLSDAKYLDMPTKYWQQEITLKDCLDTVNATFPKFRPFLHPDLVFRDAQVSIMTDKPEEFLISYARSLSEFITNSPEHLAVVQHCIRFIVHAFIVFRLLGKEISQELIDDFSEMYTEILVKLGYLTYIPYYVCQMSESKWIPVIAELVCGITSQNSRVTSEDIDLFYGSARINGLNVLSIGEEIVERLRSEDDNFHSGNLEWISLCRTHVDEPKVVTLSLLRAVIRATRVHVRASAVDRAKKYLKEVNRQALAEVSALSDLYLNTYVKEFECYTIYTEAVDNYMRWVAVLHQEPKPPNDDHSETSQDKAWIAQKRKEYNERKARWEEVFTKLSNINFQKLQSLINYENGYLLNCSSEENGPNEHLAVFESRKVILGHIVRYFMQLVEARRDPEMFSEFMTLIACSEKGVYHSLSQDLLSQVFLWSEKFLSENPKTLS